MPIDAGIYGNTHLFNAPDPSQALARIADFQQAQQVVQDQQRQMQAQQRLKDLAQQYGDDHDGLIEAFSREYPFEGAKLGEAVGKQRQELAKGYAEQSKASAEALGAGLRVLQGADDTNIGPRVDFILRAHPELTPVLSGLKTNFSPDALNSVLKIGEDQKNFWESQDAGAKAIVNDKLLGAAKAYAGATSPQQRQIVDQSLRKGGYGDLVGYFADPASAQAYVDANGKQGTEKGGQHVEGMYQGKRTFGVFDPNTNTYNVDGKTVSAKEFTPIPPASLIIHNQTAAAEAKAGTTAPTQDAQYWAEQIKRDPSMASSPLISGKANTALRSQVAHILATGGVDLDKLTAQTKQMGETARAILPHISTIEKEAQQLDQRGLMGPIGSRWRDFISGTLKATELATNAQDAKLIGKFQADLGLLRSAVARAHGGARGGGSPQMIEHMKTIIQGGGDLPTFQGSLSAVRDWMQTYQDEAHLKGIDTGSQPQGQKIGRFIVTVK